MAETQVITAADMGRLADLTPEQQIEAQRQTVLEQERMAKAAQEARERAAAEAHQLAVHVLQDRHGEVATEINRLHDDLEASIAKAASDRGHVNYASEFLRDTLAKVKEIRAWIARHVNPEGIPPA